MFLVRTRQHAAAAFFRNDISSLSNSGDSMTRASVHVWAGVTQL